MFRTTGTLPDPGSWGLTLPALLRRIPELILLAALLTASLAACGGNDEEKAAAATATSPPAARSDTPAPQVNTPAPTANETAPTGIETAARKVLADELGVDEGDFRLDSSEEMGWSDTSLGCPQEGMAYAQVITPGYKLIFDLAGTSYAVHTNIDGTNAVVCHDDSGMSTPATNTTSDESSVTEGEVAGIDRAELEDYVRLCGEGVVDIEDVEDGSVTYTEFTEAVRDRLRGFQDTTPPDVLRDFHSIAVGLLDAQLDWLEDQPRDEVIDLDVYATFVTSASMLEPLEEAESIIDALPEDLLEALSEAGCA